MITWERTLIIILHRKHAFIAWKNYNDMTCNITPEENDDEYIKT